MPKNDLIIFSFYTHGNGYFKEAEKLRESLFKHHPNFIIESAPNLGDWLRNAKQRILFLRNFLSKFERPVLSLDCDATLERPLEDIPECDIAAHIMDKRYWGQDCSKRNYSLMAGTLFFNYSQRILDLLERWHIESFQSKRWEQQILEDLLGFDKWTGEFSGSFKVHKLGPRWCAIDRTMQGIENPIIRHHQASRRLKRLTNEN